MRSQQPVRFARAVPAALLVGVGAWATLGLLAGQIGLTRPLGDPSRLIFETPAAFAASCAVAGGLAAFVGARMRASAVESALIIGGILAMNLVAAFLIAPVLVNEFRFETGPQVFAVISGLGGHMAAAGAGLLIGNRSAQPWRPT